MRRERSLLAPLPTMSGRGSCNSDMARRASTPTTSLTMQACTVRTGSSRNQDIHVGDLIPMFHEVHDLAIAYKVDSFTTDEWMLWVHRPQRDEEPDSTWSWRLTALPGGRTRLVTRMKQDYRWNTPWLAAFNLILMELGDFAMERRMLLGIKARAETVSPKVRVPECEIALAVSSSEQLDLW